MLEILFNNILIIFFIVSVVLTGIYCYLTLRENKKQPEVEIYDRVLSQKEIELLYKLTTQSDYHLNKKEIKLLEKINKSKILSWNTRTNKSKIQKGTA